MADAPSDRRSATDHVQELKSLVVGYAKQETIDPLKTLGRYLRNGVGGALLIGLGVIFLLLALLRGLQSIGSFEHNTGALSLIPYAATLAAALVVIAASLWRITKEDQKGQKS